MERGPVGQDRLRKAGDINVFAQSFIEPELLSVRNWSKSFMKRLNRRGLRLQPCRIPLLNANDFDSSWFTHILEDACAYMLCRMVSILELKPAVANLSHSRPWVYFVKSFRKINEACINAFSLLFECLCDSI